MSEGIPYRDSLVMSLEESLRRAFNQPSLVLTRKPNRHAGPFVVALGWADKTADDEDGTSAQPVMHIRLPVEQSSGFYFGFAAVFDVLTHEYILRHASLSVFHDIGELTPFFRAEWDYQAALTASSGHAQPHWHFVQQPKDIESIVRYIIEPQTEFDPEGDRAIFAGITDCGKFHFAMSSLWTTSEGASHKQVFGPDDFPKWFRNLTGYVAGQIAYVVTKAPAREFVGG